MLYIDGMSSMTMETWAQNFPWKLAKNTKKKQKTNIEKMLSYFLKSC